MAQRSGFFHSVIVEGQPDRPYSEEHFAKYFAAFIGDGVFAHNLNELKVVPSIVNMSVVVGSGRAFAKGYWYESDTEETFSFDSNSSSANPRWDAIAITFDFENRATTMSVIKGINASSYEAGKKNIYDNVIRNDDAFQLILAIIEIPANATTYGITTADIYDVRAEEYCGWVTGLVDQIDTSTIVEQMQASFDAWFQQMKDQLSSDAAGNLQNQIDAIYANEINPIIEALTDFAGDVREAQEQVRNLQTRVNYLSPTVLYDSAVGGVGTITLAGAGSVAATYDSLEIYYCDNNYATTHCMKFYNLEEGMKIVLSLVGDKNDYATYIRRVTFTLDFDRLIYKADSESLTTIARQATSPIGECVTRITSGDRQFIRILKVIGYGNELYKQRTYNETQYDVIGDYAYEEVQE